MRSRFDGTLTLLLVLAAPAAAQVPTPVGSEFQVNTYTTGYQFRPAVGPDGAGGFVVTWSGYGSSGTDSSASSIHGQKYAADGSPAGEEFQVNTYITSYQFSPAVSPDGSGASS